MKEESNAAMEACMKDWEDLSAEYLVRLMDAKKFSLNLISLKNKLR